MEAVDAKSNSYYIWCPAIELFYSSETDRLAIMTVGWSQCATAMGTDVILFHPRTSQTPPSKKENRPTCGRPFLPGRATGPTYASHYSVM